MATYLCCRSRLKQRSRIGGTEFAVILVASMFPIDVPWAVDANNAVDNLGVGKRAT